MRNLGIQQPSSQNIADTVFCVNMATSNLDDTKEVTLNTSLTPGP